MYSKLVIFHAIEINFALYITVKQSFESKWYMENPAHYHRYTHMQARRIACIYRVSGAITIHKHNVLIIY